MKSQFFMLFKVCIFNLRSFNAFAFYLYLSIPSFSLLVSEDVIPVLDSICLYTQGIMHACSIMVVDSTASNFTYWCQPPCLPFTLTPLSELVYIKSTSWQNKIWLLLWPSHSKIKCERGKCWSQSFLKLWITPLVIWAFFEGRWVLYISSSPSTMLYEKLLTTFTARNQTAERQHTDWPLY